MKPITNLFIDTEFTDLKLGSAKLISLALVNDAGTKAFYAETTMYRLEDCSEFCKAHVLPLLDLPPEWRLSQPALKHELKKYFATFDGPVRIWADTFQWDWIHITDLFPKWDWAGWPPNLEPSCGFQHYWGDDYVRAKWIQQQLQMPEESAYRTQLGYRKPFRLHHAQDDAEVNRLIWLDLQKFQSS